MSSDVGEYRERLKRVFPLVRLSSDQIYNGSPERAAVDEEVQEMIGLLSGKEWTELTLADVELLSEYLWYMTGNACRACLPAFLCLGLEECRTGGIHAPRLLASLLCPMREDGSIDHHSLELLTSLDDSQSSLVFEWLAAIGAVCEVHEPARHTAARALNWFRARGPRRASNANG